MSGFLLDTNIVSYHLRNSGEVRKRFTDHINRGDSLLVSGITHFEILYGCYKNNSTSRLRQYLTWLRPLKVIGLRIGDFQIAPQIKAILQQQGQPIEDADILIAATALHHNLTLVTHNTRHFARVSGLNIEDWTA